MNQIMFDKAALDDAALEVIGGLTAGSKAMVTVEVTIGENSEEMVDAAIDSIVDVSVAQDGEQPSPPPEEEMESEEEVPAALTVIAPPGE